MASGLDQLKMNLGSGLYGELQDIQAGQAQQAPQAQAQPEQDGGFLSGLGGVLGNLFTGASDPSLSVADETKARNKALMQGGLYTILAAQNTNDAFAAVAQGALEGQRVGEGERGAARRAGRPDQLIEEAVRSGDPNMINAVTNLLTPNVNKVSGGSLVTRPGEPMQYIADEPEHEIREGADGRIYSIDAKNATARHIEGTPSTADAATEELEGIPDWELGKDIYGRPTMYNMNNANERVVYDADYDWVFAGGELYDISSGKPIKDEVPTALDPIKLGQYKQASQGNYDKAISDHRDRAAELVNIMELTGPGQHTGQGHAGLISGMVRFSDPGSTSRFSEAELVRKAQAALQRIEAYVKANTEEDAPFLTKRTVANMRRMAVGVAAAQARVMEQNDIPRWKKTVGPLAEYVVHNPYTDVLNQHGFSSDMTTQEIIDEIEGTFFDQVKEDIRNSKGQSQDEIDERVADINRRAKIN